MAPLYVDVQVAKRSSVLHAGRCRRACLVPTARVHFLGCDGLFACGLFFRRPSLVFPKIDASDIPLYTVSLLQDY